MNKIFRISILAVLIQGGAVGAEDANTQLQNVPTPQPPLVARAAAKASWIIEIKPTDKGPLPVGNIPSLPQKYLKKQVWTKSNQMLKCVSEWSDDSQTEDWIVGRMKFYQDPQLKGIHVLSPQSDPLYHDFGTSDFEMLDWMGLDDYKGAFTYAGQPCFLFEAKDIATGPHGGESGLPNKTLRQIQAPTTPTKAYISVQTKLPVAIINGDGTFLFHFQSATEGTLAMPEPYASLWKAYKSHP
jgi:hypothetical protein